MRLPFSIFSFILAQFFVLNFSRAQQKAVQDKNDIIQQRIEFIGEQLETEEIDLTDVFEYLGYCYDNPLNLNTAKAEALEELQLLTAIQINDLLLHRKLFGKLISIYELQTLTYWDLSTIELVLPFIRVEDKLDNLHLSWKEALKYGNFELFLRYQTILETKKGYTAASEDELLASNAYYFGNADRYYSRLRYSYRTNISIGITGEKDAGEQFFRGAQKNGFDFYSAHAFYKGGKYLRSIAIGDYQIQIGQGLNLWSGYAFGKTSDVTTIKKNANTLRPYTSVDEARFMRGLAVDIGFGKFSWTSFVSVKRMDAAVKTDSISEESDFASSITLAGLHRTKSEIEKRNAITEKIMGSNLRYRNRNFQLGLAGVYQGYSVPLIKTLYPYNQFDFRGKELTSFSGDYSWVVQNFNFFGEVSKSAYSGALATIQGVLVSLDSRASLSVVYRNYPRHYHTFYNAGFSEGSNTQNEKGIYTGLKLRLKGAWTINTYLDLFQFPWLRFGVDAPSAGHEILFQISYKPSKTLEIYGRIREQMRQRNSRNTDGSVTQLEGVLQRNYRLNLAYAVDENFTLKSRIEFVSIHRKSNKPEMGMIFTQDVVFKPKTLPIDISMRFALFETDSYDSRIYAFEANALHVFAIPAYYFQGSRFYGLVRYSFAKHFDVWIRYGVFIYSNRDVIGSGPEEIQGSKKSDVTIQLRMKI